MVSRTSFELKPQVVQAGAGTGKTTHLIDEVFHIVKHFEVKYKRKPRLIICTFTRKAAYELKERLILKASKNKNLLEYINSPKLFISTLHGLFYLLLKSYGWRNDISPDFQLISDTEEMERITKLAFSLILENHLPLLEKIPFYHLTSILKFYSREKMKNPGINFYNEQDFKDMLREYNLLQKNPLKPSSLKNLLQNTESVEGHLFIPLFEEFKSLAEEFFPVFLSHKKNQGFLTMDDLELIFKDLIDRNKEILQFIAKDWDYWFIDEYQDTSRIQEQIIKKITQFKNVFCVGDPGQSIYFFRNADPEVFDRRAKEYGKEPKKLTTNYRSQTPLIYFFNEFFDSKKRFLKFKPQECSPSPHSISSIPNKTTPLKPQLPAVHFISYLSEESKESIFFKILKSIQRLISIKNKYGDIAILSTRNEDLNTLALFLTKRHIPVLSATTGGFFKKRILLDSLFLYKFLINPYDTENLIALCRTPYFHISDERLSYIMSTFFKPRGSGSLSQITKDQKNSAGNKDLNKEDSFVYNSSNEHNFSLWEHYIKNFKEDETVKNLQAGLALKKDLGILPTFEKLISQKILASKNNLSDYRETHEADIWRLLKHLYKNRDSKQNPLNFYYSFLQENLSDKEALEAPLSTASNAVNLLTIHGSKGLEFKNVILFNLSKSRKVSGEDAVYDSEKNKIAFSVPYGGRNQTKIKCYGHKKILAERTEKEEEEIDRLLYVAMTRAKNSLSLFVPEGKIPKHSWFERFSFFDNFYDKKEDGSWAIKEGLYKRKGYSLLVEKDIKDERNTETKRNLDKPYIKPASSDIFLWKNQKNLKAENVVKSSMDFINFVTSLKETEKKNCDSSIKAVNVFFKSQSGGRLHYYLRLLGSQSPDKVRKKIEASFLSSKEKQDLIKALDYVINLNQPSLSFFIKTGFTEWAFKLKEKNFTLQGQMDLWGWQEREIHLFDYKSSIKNRERTKKQLIFYSYILDQIYKPKSIKCHGVYPFQKKTEEYLYSFIQKQEVSSWLKSIEPLT